MSSTKITASMSMMSAGRGPFTRSSRNSLATRVMFSFVPGFSCAIDFASVASSARACCSVAPGASRPMTSRKCAPREAAVSSTASGTKYSELSGKRNPLGITPTTVRTRPFMCSVRPSTSGDPANWSCQAR